MTTAPAPSPTISPASPLCIEHAPPGPHAGIVTLRLEQPGKPVIVLDHDLMRRLEATLKSIPAGTAGLVLASASDRVFVAGADLKAISESTDDQLARYLEYAARVFMMLAEFPFPTVAAINGAALGGGLELAMHCDAMVAAPPPARDGQPGKPYPVGLPEAGLGLCPGWGGTNLLPARMDAADAIRRTASGQPMTFDEAVTSRLFERVAKDQPDLIPAARQLCLELRSSTKRDGAPKKWIGRPDRARPALDALASVRAELPRTDAAAAVAEAIDVGLTRGWQDACATERKRLVQLRHTPAAKSALEAFFAKSRK